MQLNIKYFKDYVCVCVFIFFIRRGESATLQCIYNMEGDSLYSIKWYKGKREFYRYTPKETPSMKIFPVAGINVEVIELYYCCFAYY